MALLCLVGRHGSGKSTLGQALVARGYVHYSVGMLRRLAIAGQFPSDVPPSLMVSLTRVRPGSPLPLDIASKLIRHVKSFGKCVIDGFPASVEHLNLLPPDARIALVWSPKLLREERLVRRGEQTVRQWIPGRASAREDELAKVILSAKTKGQMLFLVNRNSGQPAIENLASRLVAAI